MRYESGKLIYSPSDLVRFLDSPFSSWMYRYHIENPGELRPDELSEDAQLVIRTGEEHEKAVLEQFRISGRLEEITQGDRAAAETMAAIKAKAPIIYQAKLESGSFKGYSDFLILDEATGRYQVWDAKLARSLKPYYVIQLCCYSEMLSAMTGDPMPEKFGVILGADEKGVSEHIELRIEDFIHYYRYLKDSFLEMQAGYNGAMESRPEPHPNADHGRWTSYAERYLDERDHLVRVAGISVGQIKKLNEDGINTLADLAKAANRKVPKIPRESMDKLVQQARLQLETRELRKTDKNALARFEILPTRDENGQLVGLGALPPEHPADIFFDMEGYPLMPGGLEYLFGNTTIEPGTGEYEFTDFWAHDRTEEKKAFEDFVDWAYDRWTRNPGMHIYHYAAYEVSAVRNLSTRHDTRTEQVDELLRHEVFVDLYKIVRRGLRIGEESYSLKKVEHLYALERVGTVTMSIGSVVHYARWMDSGEPRNWKESPILEEIRDYNKDDCDSTAKLAKFLRKLAAENDIPPAGDDRATRSSDLPEEKELPPEVIARLAAIDSLRENGDEISKVIADLVEFHRREAKPIWWKMFDRIDAEPDELRDDIGCIAQVEAIGDPVPEKRSLLQEYSFDPAQDCKASAGDKFMFTHSHQPKLELVEIDAFAGRLKLKATQRTLDEHFEGSFPTAGSLIPDEYVDPRSIAYALSDIAQDALKGEIHAPLKALLSRKPPPMGNAGSVSTVEAAVDIAREMSGDCLVIQGPPGTGKTYTASHVISALLADGKRVGISSNSHKAIINLLGAIGKLERSNGRSLSGIRVGGSREEESLAEITDLRFVKTGGEALAAYTGGVVAGTAFLFSRKEWAGQIDHLFVDEAGQVSLANVAAMLRSTKNLILLGDQMQLEQPTQGMHPGDSRLSALQYALKDVEASEPDAPVFHAVVPPEYGLFLGESRRMHPSVCEFISESIYDGKLTSFADCSKQTIEVPENAKLITKPSGIVFSGVEHDGFAQKSEEEAERIKDIFDEMIGRTFTTRDGTARPLELNDFLFIAPYNAQVRILQQALPRGARVGSVDKFQGQEAPVCILSLCSSFGEYGSRGLGFILDRNRINVAVSRAQCLAVVTADPRIAGTAAASITEMRLLNLFCKLVRLDKFEPRSEKAKI